MAVLAVLAAPAAMTALVALAAALAACSASVPPAGSRTHATAAKTARLGRSAHPVPAASRLVPPLAEPARLTPFGERTYAAEGAWHPAGRLVDGMPAIYETTIVPQGGTARAGIAWMDAKLLSARLYSGSQSPGGGPYRYTAPVLPGAAASLVAAFNGGFMMNAAHGGYYTEGRVIDPLVRGAASLVIYADGAITVGAWGTGVAMSPKVVAVRQNLVPLVAGGHPTALAASPDWQSWGYTCGVISCSPSVQGIESQWRSGLGVAADGALVYAAGPALDPLQLARLLVRAGAVRGMELDINPGWPVFASYDPATTHGLAAPSNGANLLDTDLGPSTFFAPSYRRDFITMSARPISNPAGTTPAPPTPAPPTPAPSG